MDGGFQFVDIILFAMIAIFLILRLRNTLGRRDGSDGKHVDPFSQRDRDDDANAESENGDNVVHLPGHENNQESQHVGLDGEPEPIEPQTP